MQLYKVRVIIKGKYAFTCDSKEEFNNSIILPFTAEQADTLVSGGGIDTRDIHNYEIRSLYLVYTN